MKHLFLLPIKLYQTLISPFFGGNCRYLPTCSEYATEAIKKHGGTKGSYLSLKRIFSCHPFCHKNRYDPVPERFAWRDLLGYKKRRNNNNLHPDICEANCQDPEQKS